MLTIHTYTAAAESERYRRHWSLRRPAALTTLCRSSNVQWEGFQDVIHLHLLPQLPAADCGRLACTCRFLRRCLAQALAELWRNLAAQVLPQGMSPTSPLTQVHSLLRRFGAAKANVKAGRAADIVPSESPTYGVSNPDQGTVLELAQCSEDGALA